MNKQVINLLKKNTLIEQTQLKTRKFINDMPSQVINIKHVVNKPLRILSDNNYFFKYHPIYLSKHNRYAPYPEHMHKFLELNYMLKGSCNQIVSGHKVFLNQGDILLMDIGCSHSIKPLGKNDLLINLLFQNKEINLTLINQTTKNTSITYDFLSRISLGKKTNSNYIIFPQNKDIQTTMNEIIEEYFMKKSYSNLIIKSYLNILLAKLIRHYPLPTHKIQNSKQKLVLKCLKDIAEDYKDINLSKLSKKYGYNRNYLSNIITQITGNNFSQLLTKQRIIIANDIISSTALPIDKVIKKVGIKNKSFFYKKYKSYYHCLPISKRRSYNKNFSKKRGLALTS